MEERFNEREIICVICPNSCRLTIWRDKEGEVNVKGNKCARGLDYGKNEYTNPVRMLITTMRVEGGTLPVIPVRSVAAIRKDLVMRAIKEVNDQFCTAPVKMGDVVIQNILGTGVDVIASRDMNAVARRSVCADVYADYSVEETLHHTLVESLYGGNAHLNKDQAQLVEEMEKNLLARLHKFMKTT